MHFSRNIAFAVVFASVLSSGSPAPAVTLDWIRQFAPDAPRGLSADGLGNVLVSTTDNPFVGGVGDEVRKINSEGELVWSRLADGIFGPHAILADNQGNYFLYGAQGGGSTHLNKHNQHGQLLWTQHLAYRFAAASIDHLGNVFVGGSDFCSKVSPQGTILWTRQIGQEGRSTASSVSTDAEGNVYVAGSRNGDLGGPVVANQDAFLMKYSPNGNLLWDRRFGSEREDNASSVAVDGLGNVFVTGGSEIIEGRSGGRDAGAGFLAKYDANGNEVWTQFIEVDLNTNLGNPATNDTGALFRAGSQGAAGSRDTFVAKYDSAGNHTSITRLEGLADNRASLFIDADALGNIFVLGTTTGSLGGTHHGGTDVFLAKFSDLLPGDLNDDGAVDAADYAIWRKGFSSGAYTEDDYAAWWENFGAPAAGAAAGAEAAIDRISAGASSPAVPEPGALALVAVALVLLRLRLRSKS
jgi:hypothetical protein